MRPFLLSILKALLYYLPAFSVVEKSHINLIPIPVLFSLESYRIFLLVSSILAFLRVDLSLISVQCKLYEGRDLYLFCLLLYLQSLEQWPSGVFLRPEPSWFGLSLVETFLLDGGGHSTFCREWARAWGSYASHRDF